ncbi:MAG: DUF2442 domain-containing protein [Bacteroidales bacterium]|nr:DUF2442 domain-containing protein [Bacteroidales bacterium]
MNERIQEVWFKDERIFMRSSLGNEYSRPLESFPRLKDANSEERNSFTIRLQGEAIRWEGIDEDIHVSSFFDKDEPKYDNAVGNLFKKFPQLNVSEIAKSIGINKSLLSQYIYGIKTPSEKRMNEIKAALNNLGKELIKETE